MLYKIISYLFTFFCLLQYDLTETITVPPAAHQELVPTSDSIKLLSNYGIRMLPEDDSGDASVAMSGGTVSLTEAGKRILNDTSNPSVIKKLVATPKLQTVQIKQEGSATPKIIRINGSTANIKSENSNSSVIQPATRVIRLSTSQLQNIKLGRLDNFCMIVLGKVIRRFFLPLSCDNTKNNNLFLLFFICSGRP